MQRLYQTEITHDYGEGTAVLNALVGTNGFNKQNFTGYLKSLKPKLETVIALENTKLAL